MKDINIIAGFIYALVLMIYGTYLLLQHKTFEGLVLLTLGGLVINTLG